MNNVLKNVLIFTSGAGCGCAAMYFIAKRIFLEKYEKTVAKYEELLNNLVTIQEKPEEIIVDEIEINEEYAKAIAKRKELNKPDVTSYVKTLKKEGYVAEEDRPIPVDYTSFSKKTDNKPVEEKGKNDVEEKEEKIPPIRIVTEEYFDELDEDDYKFIGFTYFDDHVLADENDEAMDDEEIERTVTAETLRWIDSHEDVDSIYVVNEILNTAYEITRDLRTYEDVVQARGGW